MPRSNLEQLEARFFRHLNAVVEPALRAGWGSTRYTPTTAIVLETRGRETGQRRRTPLAALLLGKTPLVATCRGNRSHWVRNLVAQPRTTFWLGGRRHPARAWVLEAGAPGALPKGFPDSLRTVSSLVAVQRRLGWAFVFLVPRAAARRAS